MPLRHADSAAGRYPPGRWNHRPAAPRGPNTSPCATDRPVRPAAQNSLECRASRPRAFSDCAYIPLPASGPVPCGTRGVNPPHEAHADQSNAKHGVYPPFVLRTARRSRRISSSRARRLEQVAARDDADHCAASWRPRPAAGSRPPRPSARPRLDTTPAGAAMTGCRWIRS